MKRINLTQSSGPWLQWRTGGIGGSDVGVIMGVSPYNNRANLLIQKAASFGRKAAKGGPNRDNKNEAMLRGIRMEPIARDLYIALTGNYCEPACCEHPEIPYLRASLDGITPDEKIAIEIKCIKYEYHCQALEGIVPTLYWPQVQHNLLCSGAKVLDYFSYSEHSKFKGSPQNQALIRVKHDLGYQELMVAEVKKFWDDLQALLKKPEVEVSQAIVPPGYPSCETF